MKILHLSNVFGQNIGGGIHEVVKNFFIFQKKFNHEPHIWYPGTKSADDLINHEKYIKNFDFIYNNRFGVFKEIFNDISDEITSFQILHQHGIWTPLSLYSLKIKKKSNIKSILQPHGFLMPHSYAISNFKKKIAFNFFEKLNFRLSDVLVACSKNEVNVLKKLFPKKDIALIPNGVSKSFLNKKIEVSKSDKKRLLFLSQIIPIKAIERVLFSINKLGVRRFSDWEFIIAGYENQNYKSYLIKIISEYKLSSIVKFVGPVFGNEKINLLDSSDVFVLPSLNENFGIVVAEALARGIPVLTTKGTPWEELNTINCGLCVDNSEEGIREGLSRLIELSRKELSIMGLKGKKLIKDKYLWDNTALLTLELYEWMIKNNNKPDFIY